MLKIVFRWTALCAFGSRMYQDILPALGRKDPSNRPRRGTCVKYLTNMAVVVRASLAVSLAQPDKVSRCLLESS